jgi:L-amino acid N-acyltransferase YncA
MIVTHDQFGLAHWLQERIGLVPTPNLRCIGNVLGGKLLGVVGYDNYNGASIMMHSAGEGNWLTQEMLYAVFHYPFDVCKVNVVIGLVPSGNRQALRFNSHIGFKTVTDIVGAHPDGSLVVMAMRRGECRYLNRRRHGQEIEAAASA